MIAVVGVGDRGLGLVLEDKTDFRVKMPFLYYRKISMPTICN